MGKTASKEAANMEEQENKSDEKEVYIVIKNSEDSSVMNLKYLKGIKILSILHLVSGVLVFLMDLVTVFFRSEGHTYEDNNVNTVMGFFASLFIITGGRIHFNKKNDTL